MKPKILVPVASALFDMFDAQAVYHDHNVMIKSRDVADMNW